MSHPSKSGRTLGFAIAAAFVALSAYTAKRLFFHEGAVALSLLNRWSGATLGIYATLLLVSWTIQNGMWSDPKAKMNVRAASIQTAVSSGSTLLGVSAPIIIGYLIYLVDNGYGNPATLGFAATALVSAAVAALSGWYVVLMTQVGFSGEETIAVTGGSPSLAKSIPFLVQTHFISTAACFVTISLSLLAFPLAAARDKKPAAASAESAYVKRPRPAVGTPRRQVEELWGKAAGATSRQATYETLSGSVTFCYDANRVVGIVERASGDPDAAALPCR